MIERHRGRGDNRLPALADEIRHHLAEAKRHAGAYLASAIEAGKRLTEAKAQLPHGQWQQWLHENFNMSARTARVLMQIAEAVPKLPESERQRAAILSIRAALELLAQKNRKPATAKVPVIEPPTSTKPPDTVARLKTEKAALEARTQEAEAAYQLIKDQQDQQPDEPNDDDEEEDIEADIDPENIRTAYFLRRSYPPLRRTLVPLTRKSSTMPVGWHRNGMNWRKHWSKPWGKTLKARHITRIARRCSLSRRSGGHPTSKADQPQRKD
jgi:hypothetical protein